MQEYCPGRIQPVYMLRRTSIQVEGSPGCSEKMVDGAWQAGQLSRAQRWNRMLPTAAAPVVGTKAAAVHCAAIESAAAAAQKQEERSNVEMENHPKRSQVSQQGSISEKIQKAYRK